MTTPDIKDLIARLRAAQNASWGLHPSAAADAADALESQAAELARLQGINRSLVDKCNAQNIHGARQDEELARVRAGAVPEGWRLLQDTTYAERSWPEDASHENGNYSNTCVDCGRTFTGHKRRPVCKVCASSPQPTEQPAPPSAAAAQPVAVELIMGAAEALAQRHYECMVQLTDAKAKAFEAAEKALRTLAERAVATPPAAWAAALAAQPVEPVEMSPEFTDTARAALLWVLWHHQGGSSPVGQPLRFSLGMGAHDRLSERQIAEAKRWAALTGSATADFHNAVHPAAPIREQTAEPAPIDMILYCPNCGMQHVDAPEFNGTREDKFPAFGEDPAMSWTNPPHRSHLCHGCGCIWRPADVPTNGVAEIKTEGKADSWPVNADEISAQRAGSVDARVVEDAERYRWLRDVSVPPHNFYLSVPVEFAGVMYTPQEVDAAIDAAIDAAAGKGETS